MFWYEWFYEKHLMVRIWVKIQSTFSQSEMPIFETVDVMPFITCNLWGRGSDDLTYYRRRGGCDSYCFFTGRYSYILLIIYTMNV